MRECDMYVHMALGFCTGQAAGLPEDTLGGESERSVLMAPTGQASSGMLGRSVNPLDLFPCL